MVNRVEDQEALDSWIRFLSSWRPRTVPADPGEFVEDWLGYEFLPFHRRWWQFFVANRVSLLLAPRGHGKSTILSIAFPLYRVLQNPELRVLLCSNTADQAAAFLREIRKHLDFNLLIAQKRDPYSGGTWTRSELSLASRMRNSKEATFTALGVMGPIISKHYDLVILDDVVDEDAARSPSRRERLLTWYYKELLPTLEPEGELHLLGTRYHPEDLYGKLIQTGLPALVEKAIRGREGRECALWEEKFGLALLKKIRDEAGPAIFNAQYQNDVTTMAGRIFKPEWIVIAGKIGGPDFNRASSGANKFAPTGLGANEFAPTDGLFCRKYQGVDLAIGQKDHHDYFAHVTVAETGNRRFHVLSVYRGRLTFEEQFRTIGALFALHDRPESPVVAVGVEANSYQEAMAQRLRRETRLPVVSVVQTKDKIARALRLTGLLESNRLTFPPAGAADLIAELLAFPDAAHDDLLDALEIAVGMGEKVNQYSDLPFRDLNLRPEP